MGWCSVGTSGEECDPGTCSDIRGDYSTQRPGGCLVLSLLEDPTARAVIRGMLYPPILLVRDEVLPRSPVGRVIVEDFDRHYAEAVSILRKDPDLLDEVISFMTANVPFAHALNGGAPARKPANGWTPSSYLGERLRPGTVDWFSQILERFRGSASEEFAESIAKYLTLVPLLQGLTPTELLTQLRSKELDSLVRR